MGLVKEIVWKTYAVKMQRKWVQNHTKIISVMLVEKFIDCEAYDKLVAVKPHTFQIG